MNRTTLAPSLPLRSRTLRSLTLLCPLLVACSSAPKADPAAKSGPATVTEHKCRVEIAAAGEPLKVEGQAQGEDEAAALEAAFADACGKLPEAERAACRDEEKFEVMIAGASGTLDGKVNHSKTVTLKARVASVDGEGASASSKEEACAAAIAAACEAAGASGDCVAAGSHAKRGESSSTSTRRAAQPS